MYILFTKPSALRNGIILARYEMKKGKNPGRYRNKYHLLNFDVRFLLYGQYMLGDPGASIIETQSRIRMRMIYW